MIWFGFETFFGLKILPHHKEEVPDSGFRVTILIPAHNEERLIGSTIQALRLSGGNSQVLVVADNCSDATAAEARSAGADVIERVDPTARGKGFALAFGRDHLRRNAPDAVVVLDADCFISENGPKILGHLAVKVGAPVQAANLFIPTENAGANVAISNFAMFVKNVVRARGMKRIGGAGLLYGTGMAFPWKIFSKLPLATSDATEDIALGLDLARGGTFVTLADHVQVSSAPAAAQTSRGQRSRWEHGFLKNMFAQAFPLIACGLLRGSRRLFGIGMHMAIPPLALLVTIWLVLQILIVLVGLLTQLWVPAILLFTAFGFVTISLTAAWFFGGRRFLSARTLLSIPAYIVWKLPIYTSYFRRHRQTDWNRTKRD